MKKQETESFRPERPVYLDLADLYGPALTLIVQLRRSHDYGDASILRQRFRELLERIERDARGAGYNQADIRLAKFACVAFLDETIIASEWSKKEEWLTRPLQLELFDRFDAGEEFFTNLERLRQRPLENINLLKIYYLCMALGFRGKYQVVDREQIRRLIEEVFSEIVHLQRKPLTYLSPHGERRDEIVNVVVREVPSWIIGVFALAAGFIFFIVMSFLISRSAEDVKAVIQGIP